MEIRRINNSEIQTFKRCKRKWFLEYYKGLTADRDTTALDIGNLVHAGLENYYNGDTELILQPVEDAEIAWALANADNGTSEREYPDNKVLRLARAMLEGYVPWIEESGEDANLKITGVEEELETSLGEVRGREIILHGRVDARFVDPDGNPVLLDHKTTDSFTIYENRRIRLNEQLMTYAMLLRMAKGEEVKGACINMIRKTLRTSRATPPFYKRAFVYFNIEQLRSHHAQILAVVEDVLALEDKLHADPSLTNAAAYPTVDTDCSWKCPFLAICPMFGDGSNIEGAVKGMLKAKEYHA